MTSDSSMECASRLATLPHELLDTITTYLDAPQQKQLRRVNRCFLHLVTPTLFASLGLVYSNRYDPLVSEAEQELLQTSFLAFLQHLERQHSFCPAMSVARHVRSIKMNRGDLSIQDLCRFLQVCPDVNTLVLHSFVFSESYRRLSSAKQSRLDSHTTELHAHLKENLRPLFDSRPNIKTLKLIDAAFQPLLYDIIHSILPHLSHLRSLDLGVRESSIRDDSSIGFPPSLAQLQSCCPQLESLIYPVTRQEYGSIYQWKDEKKKGTDPDAVIEPWTTVTDLWMMDPSNNFTVGTLGSFAAFTSVKFPRVKSFGTRFEIDYDQVEPVGLNQAWMDPSLASFLQLEALDLQVDGCVRAALLVFNHFTSTEPRALKSLTIHLDDGDNSFDFLDVLSQFSSIQHLRTEGSGGISAAVTNDTYLVCNSLTSINMARSWPVYHQHSDAALLAIGKLCPQLQHLKFTLGPWEASTKKENSVAFTIKEYALDQMNLVSRCILPQPKVIALPDFNNLSSLDIDSFEDHDVPGLLFVAEVECSSSSLGHTATKAWYIEPALAEGQPRKIRRLGNGNHPELDGLDDIGHWDETAAVSDSNDSDTSSETPTFEGFVNVIVMQKLPKNLYFNSQKLSM